MNKSAVKRASADHPIHEMIGARYSPYSFAQRNVEPQKVLSCLEAARWAPSSYNEQPWSFILAVRENEAEFRQMIECLVEGNQDWAQHAAVLLLTVVRKNFSRNNHPNRAAEHDIGLAAGNLTLQATALGLHVHQMAGINGTKCRLTYQIPDSHIPLTAIAIGYAADSDQSESDRTPRTRRKLHEFVYSGTWNQASPLVKQA